MAPPEVHYSPSLLPLLFFNFEPAVGRVERTVGKNRDIESSGGLSPIWYSNNPFPSLRVGRLGPLPRRSWSALTPSMWITAEEVMEGARSLMWTTSKEFTL